MTPPFVLFSRTDRRLLARATAARVVAFLGALLLAAALSAQDGAAASAAPQGRWKLFDFPQNNQEGHIASMVYDENGKLWAMVNSKLSYFDGKQFVPFKEIGNDDNGALFGGPDQGLYMNGFYEEEEYNNGWGRRHIARMKDGKIKRVATYVQEDYYDRRGFYASKNGRFFYWNTKALAVYRDGEEWYKIKAHISNDGHLFPGPILDLGEQLFFVGNNELLQVDQDYQIKEIEPAGWRDFNPKATYNEHDYCEHCKNIEAHLWGDGKALFYDHANSGLYGLDLRSLEPAPIDALRERLKGFEFWAGHSLSDGSVLLVGNRWVEDDQDWQLFRIDPAGNVAELPDPLGHLAYGSQAALLARDGSIWLGTERESLVIASPDGRVLRAGWKEGLSSRIEQILEDPKTGDIWIGMFSRAARFTPGAAEVAAPVELSVWEEYVNFAGTQVFRLPNGDMAMFRRDHPKALARWDGKKWTFQDVPFNPDEVSTPAADDRGHIIVMGHGNGARSRCWEIGPNSIKEREWLGAALQEALAEGAKSFPQGWLQPLVQPDGKICFSYGDNLLSFDGEKWQGAHLQDGILGIFPSKRWGIVVTQGTGVIYQLNLKNGELIKLNSYGENKFQHYLLSPLGIQPFEEELFAERPDFYYRYWKNGYIFFDDTSFAEPEAHEEQGARENIGYELALQHSDQGGAWLSGSASYAYRLFGRTIMMVDFDNTPLDGRELRRVIEDPRGDVWFETGGYSGKTQVFVYKAASLGLSAELGRIPPASGPQFFPPLMFSEKLNPKSVFVFARVNDGKLVGANESEWLALGQVGKPEPLVFPEPGRYKIELALFDMGVRLQAPEPFEIEVRKGR
jgi:hypothetical protein